MTPYIIISTKNTFSKNGIHTMVSNHALKTNLQDCLHWIDTMNKAHGLVGNRETFKNEDESYIVYEAQFTNEDGEHGWVEYEIWKENDINL